MDLADTDLSPSEEPGEKNFAAEFQKLEQASKVATDDNQRKEREELERIRGRWEKNISNLLMATTIVILICVAGFCIIDIRASILAIGSHERFITDNVLMTLIGASIVQVGAIAALVGNWSFKSKRH